MLRLPIFPSASPTPPSRRASDRPIIAARGAQVPARRVVHGRHTGSENLGRPALLQEWQFGAEARSAWEEGSSCVRLLARANPENVACPGTTTASKRHRLTYLRALDGVGACAVLAVMAHLGGVS